MKKYDKLAIIQQHYPKAQTTIDSVNHFIDFIEGQLDLEPSKVMLADSICSDDVNSIQYPARTQEFLGPFKMGGLDGFPFTGLTGMGAFASHVPDEGAVGIYYGPHIGITENGTIGEIHRHGQSKNSSCCGAAKGALNKLINNLIIEGNITDMDYQMNTIEQILLNKKKGFCQPLSHETCRARYQRAHTPSGHRRRHRVTDTDVAVTVRRRWRARHWRTARDPLPPSSRQAGPG